jgi:hypothetical protein
MGFPTTSSTYLVHSVIQVAIEFPYRWTKISLLKQRCRLWKQSRSFVSNILQLMLVLVTVAEFVWAADVRNSLLTDSTGKSVLW